ncbi:TrmB family transcriptional regulator [Candidatus Woesearchaeota archaeon]|jgi:HTH-type transcriptional regulator, sugar sensing transcriptional regulator|nr:TrmB family transcriptional regulator [Candidatus Woesearchaeota archaeon]MBT6518760.1 TrmB family transcriptional regulator [Candidatus Woesearchaeota archaeon]MBT7366960.1 TrmB family transcriptional regulator [Candidatus Woesearchaeota archaeon]
MKENLIDLSEYGLTKYENKAYQALLLENSAIATKISHLSGVPHGKIYPTLYSLEKKGFILKTPEKPIRFIAVPPEKAIKTAISNKEKEVVEFEKDVNNITKNLGKLAGRREAEPLEKIRVIKGYKKYRELVHIIQQSAKKEFLSITRLPNYEPYIKDFKKGIGLGMDIKLIVSTPQIDEEKINVWKSLKANIRKTKFMQTRFTVIDGKQVMIRFSGKNQYLGLWIQNESLAKSMRSYFYKLWEGAKKI